MELHDVTITTEDGEKVVMAESAELTVKASANDKLKAMTEWATAQTQDSLAKAKERANQRKAKYGEVDNTVMFTPIPKNVMIRNMPATLRIGDEEFRLDRKFYRATVRFFHKMGFTDEQIVTDLNGTYAKAMEMADEVAGYLE